MKEAVSTSVSGLSCDNNESLGGRCLGCAGEDEANGLALMMEERKHLGNKELTFLWGRYKSKRTIFIT